MFEMLEFRKRIFPKNESEFSWTLFYNLVGSKSGIMGLGAMDISTSCKTHKHDEQMDFGKVKVNSYSFLMLQNNQTELLAFPEFTL